MPTPVSITCGNTSRDYSTLVAATAGTEVINRVSNDEVIKIVCYNDDNNPITAGAASIAAGAAANNVTIEPAPGEDYAANDYSSKALKYDPADGVAIEASASFSAALLLNGASTTIINNVQFDCPSIHGGEVLRGSDTTSQFNGCIIQTDCGNETIRMGFDNCLFIRYGFLGSEGITYSLNTVSGLQQCTIVCPEDLSSTAAGIGFHASPLINEVAIFGFQSSVSGSASGSSDYNATDDSTVPGSNSLDSLTYADQFEDVDDATQDWRMKSGNDLDGAGAGGIDIGYRIPDAIPGGEAATSANDEFYKLLLTGGSL